MKNKGTNIEHVIAYLEKRKAEGYTHVAVETLDKEYNSILFYDECSRKDEGVLLIGSSCRTCFRCNKFYPNGERRN